MKFKTLGALAALIATVAYPIHVAAYEDDIWRSGVRSMLYVSVPLGEGSTQERLPQLGVQIAPTQLPVDTVYSYSQLPRPEGAKFGITMDGEPILFVNGADRSALLNEALYADGEKNGGIPGWGWALIGAGTLFLALGIYGAVGFGNLDLGPDERDEN